MKDEDENAEIVKGSALPWTLGEKPKDGHIRTTKRSAGTVQKDWAVVKSNALPEHFCIAVVGHEGWSCDPDSTARYTLAVSFEILGQEIAIYEPLRVAVHELQAEIESSMTPAIEIEAEEEEE
jgi:hypothetical protein